VPWLSDSHILRGLLTSRSRGSPKQITMTRSPLRVVSLRMLPMHQCVSSYPIRRTLLVRQRRPMEEQRHRDLWYIKEFDSTGNRGVASGRRNIVTRYKSLQLP
jgi:hypothetical protein